MKKHVAQMGEREREQLVGLRDSIISSRSLHLSLHCQTRLAENGLGDQVALVAAVQGRPIEVNNGQGDELRVVLRHEERNTAHCVVLGDGGCIITYWANGREDRHSTLRLGEYNGWWAWWREVK